MQNKSSTWIELNSLAFEDNVKQIKQIIGESVLLSVVVKGNAYGHGLIPVAQLCQNSSYVDWLCTVSLSEALLLRKHAITKPILVLSYIDADPSLAIANDIDLTMQDIETALFVHSHAEKIKKPARIHIKIDTGMSRLGFTPENALNAIVQLMQLPYLIIYGISTHFCDTTNPASEFTAQQSARFHTLAHALANHGIEIPIKHAANSATTLNHPENRFNLVRIGAAAYGLLRSTDTLHQTPIATWKTRIAFIRTIPTGSFVSYDLTYQTTEKTIIAILPIGYYNGYNRRLSNNSTVLVYNARSQSHVYAPVIGRIAMNHTIINVTHITDASTDDEVILMGPYEKITPYDIAQYTQSCNPREITTTIHEAIPRTIVENSSEIGTISVSTASNEFCKQS